MNQLHEFHLHQALVKAAYASLGLQTYFTSGPTETRAWTIRKGMTAPQVTSNIRMCTKSLATLGSVFSRNEFY